MLCCVQLGRELCDSWEQVYCVLSAELIVGISEVSRVYQGKSSGDFLFVFCFILSA